MPPSCLFCKIVTKELPAHIIAETETALVIKDISPKADLHWLVIPRIHHDDLRSYAPGDTLTLGELLQTARMAVQKFAHNAPFKMIINNGSQAGQRIFHTHLHILSGTLHEDWKSL